MRQSVHSTVAGCDKPLPVGQKYVAVQFLSGDTVYFVVDVKVTGQELFDQVCESIKLNDAKLFGLALVIDSDYHFLDLQLRLSKYAPKTWKSLNGNGLNAAGVPSLTFHFRVQFYIDCHLLISDRIARHHYYLQLRENLVTYNQALSEERAFLLAAHALQADLGNYNIEKHQSGYFDPRKYFPSWIVDKVGIDYIVAHTPSMHKDNFGFSRGEAQILFLKESSATIAPHNLHLYRLHRKKSKEVSTVWLGICYQGIHIYEENGNCTKKHLSLFLWSDISKLYFDKKKFEIRSGGCPEPRKFTYYTNNDELSKHLLWLCRTTHQFNMFIQPQAKELQRRDSGDTKHYRESYIYSDSLDLAWEEGQRKGDSAHNGLFTISPLKKGGSSGSDQCVSVISNASSNTTSGIVSDKMHSHDESEDDLDLELVSSHASNRASQSRNNEMFHEDSELYHCSCLSTSADNLDKSVENDGHDCNCRRNRCHSEPVTFTNAATSFNSDMVSSSLPVTSLLKQQPTDVRENAHLKNYSGDSHYHTNGCKGYCHNEQHLKLQAKGSFAKYSGIQRNSDCCQRCKETNDARKHKEWMIAMKSSHISSELCPAANKCNSLKSHGIYNNCYHGMELKMCNGDCSKNETVSGRETRCLSSPLPTLPNYYLNQSSSVPHHHGRTATRIGVSSLTRVHGFPVSLFGNHAIGAASSEPSLYNSVAYNNLPQRTLLQAGLSSLPLTHINIQSNLAEYSHINNSIAQPKDKQYDELNKDVNTLNSRNLSEPLQCGKNRFSIVPTPSMTYASESFYSKCERGQINNQVEENDSSMNSEISYGSRMRLGSLPVLPLSVGDSAIDGNMSTSSNSLDLQQLRQKSRDMDLPLISALCNDRSLLMLPKTVPTCSRQRHMGKDIRRFSCSAVSPPVCGDQRILSNDLSSMGHRPMSWHVDPEEHSWSQRISDTSEVLHAPPVSYPLYPSISESVVSSKEISVASSSVSSTPILTSFKTSEKNNGGIKDIMQLNRALPCSSKQMLPMKLSACHGDTVLNPKVGVL